MSIDKKILSELDRYNQINKYIMEQADLGALAPPPADPAAPPPPAPSDAVPPPAPTGAAATPEKIDVESDPDVEKIGDDGKSEEKSKDEEGTEELDITELVDSQKSIETKQEEYFNNLFTQLNDLQSRLGEMDQIMTKLNTLEDKIEKYRQKTPEERLELRSLDSYPFNQKLSQFFDEKEEDMDKTGKNDYVLTSDQVMDINATDIKNSFQPGSEPIDNFEFKR